MSETIECKFNNSDYFYTNPDYTVFNLTNFDHNAECKILITNRFFIEKQKGGVAPNNSKNDCEEPEISQVSQSKSVSRKRKLPADADESVLSDIVVVSNG